MPSVIDKALSQENGLIVIREEPVLALGVFHVVGDLDQLSSDNWFRLISRLDLMAWDLGYFHFPDSLQNIILVHHGNVGGGFMHWIRSSSALEIV